MQNTIFLHSCVTLRVSADRLRNISYTFPYNVNSNVSSFNVLAGTGTGKADAFASDLCVVTEDRMGDGSVDMTQASAAVLFDVNNREVL